MHDKSKQRCMPTIYKFPYKQSHWSLTKYKHDFFLWKILTHTGISANIYLIQHAHTWGKKTSLFGASIMCQTIYYKNITHTKN